MSYFVVDENRLFCTDEGRDREPVLFVHGGTCDSHDWSMQIGAFAERHRVIVPDLRGHGRSEQNGASHLPSDYVTDLAVMLEKLDAAPAVVVGHSLGALVASILSVERPDLVRAVVVVDPAWGFAKEFAAAMTVAFHAPDPVGIAAAALGQMEGPGSNGASWLGDWHRRRVFGMAPEVVADVFLGMFDKESSKIVRGEAEQYLARRSCPVLTVSATASLQNKGIDEAWDRSVSPHPHSESVAWEDVGHWLFQERPAEFNALVLDWIERLPS